MRQRSSSIIALLCWALGPRSLWALALALARSGTSLVALVRFGAARGLADAAVVDERERVRLRALAGQSEHLAGLLLRDHRIGRGEPVGILGVNSVGFVRALLAVSRLGARAVLLGPHLPAAQVAQLLDQHRIALVLSPDGVPDPVIGQGRRICVPDELLEQAHGDGPRLPRFVQSEIVVLTGGTTGLPKPARRAAAASGVLRLFLHLVAALRLHRRRAVLVAAPLFHGFGLAALIVTLALGRTVHLRRRFEADEAVALIRREDIDTLVVVPTLLRRLLRTDDASLPLACIVTGGAALPVEVAAQTRDRWGGILFNLYGTSEAGLSTLATPADLAAAPGTIGRAMWGAEVQVRDSDGALTHVGATGTLFVRNRASIAPRAWIATGDLARRDGQGRLFVCGRTDDTIVSGGENVHPYELEAVLLAHTGVEAAVAIGVADVDFGERLIAVVVPRTGCALRAADLSTWLRGRVARHLIPRAIVVRDTLPLTAIGKVDRRALSHDLAGHRNVRDDCTEPAGE